MKNMDHHVRKIKQYPVGVLYPSLLMVGTILLPGQLFRYMAGDSFYSCGRRRAHKNKPVEYRRYAPHVKEYDILAFFVQGKLCD